jgi:hypothetical protein
MSEKFLDPARHEPADVGRRFILAGSALVLVSVFISGLIVLWLYPGATTDRTLRLPLRRYPDPQLQVNPAADMARFRDEEMRQLNGAGWVDKENRIAHIPVADAMRKIAQESIPGWPRAAEPPVARKNSPASPAPAEQPHEAQETVPSSPASTEKAHAAARSIKGVKYFVGAFELLRVASADRDDPSIAHGFTQGLALVDRIIETGHAGGDQITENSGQNGEQYADLKRDRHESRPGKFRTAADVERIADRIRINFHPKTG